MISQDVRQSFSAGADAASAPKPDLSPQQRLELARQELILPWAMRLSQFDHLAEVYVVGGASDARNQPTSKESNLEYYYSGLNHGSDLDVIVISPRLLTPKHYVRFLEDLSAAGAELKERSGLQPVFFCHSTSKHARVSVAKILYGANVVPVHFLFYPSADAFYGREGALAESLSKRASPIVRRDVPPTRQPQSWDFKRRIEPGSKSEMSGLDCGHFYPARAARLRWDLECAVADFVLNYPQNAPQEASHVEFLKGEFAEYVRKSFRNFNLSKDFPNTRDLPDSKPRRGYFFSEDDFANSDEYGLDHFQPRKVEQKEIAAKENHRRFKMPSAPPSFFGHSRVVQRQIIDLACQAVGRISQGDFSPERDTIVHYGRLLLEACFVGHGHKHAFKRALEPELPDREWERGSEGLWSLADRLAADGELGERTHIPLGESELVSGSVSDRRIYCDPCEISNNVLMVPPEGDPKEGGCSADVEALFRAPYQVPPEEREKKIQQISELLTDDVIRQGLMSAHSDVRARAIECWGRSSIAPDLIDLIVEVAQEDDSRVRAWALHALAHRAPSNEQVVRFVASHFMRVELSVGLAAVAAGKKLTAHLPDLLRAVREATRCPTAKTFEFEYQGEMGRLEEALVAVITRHERPDPSPSQPTPPPNS